MIRRPPTSTPLPYPTLFRSTRDAHHRRRLAAADLLSPPTTAEGRRARAVASVRLCGRCASVWKQAPRAWRKPIGLLVNFNVALLKNAGVVRKINTKE